MFKLETFYQSKEWLAFRLEVINARTREDGFVYDEITNKPILRAYDLILHHKIELTEENVNDLNISLNPENVQIVSHKTHNMIHDRFNNYAAWRRNVFIVYGPPLSGKSSYVREIKNAGDLVLDMDSIWECISGCNRYYKPNALKDNAFAVRDCLLDCVRYRRGHWLNAYIIGGYPLVSERDRLTRDLGARLIFVDTPKAVCLERLAQDEVRGGIPEYAGYIEDWFRLYEIGKG